MIDVIICVGHTCTCAHCVDSLAKKHTSRMDYHSTGSLLLSLYQFVLFKIFKILVDDDEAPRLLVEI